jgi:hypothetical protein
MATIGAALMAVGAASAQVQFDAGPGALEWRSVPDPTPVGTVTTSGTVLL